MKTERSGEWLRVAIPLLVAGLLALVAWKLGFFTKHGSQRALAEVERIAGRRYLATIFVTLYATLACFGLPVTVLAYGAGAIWGFGRGAWWVWLASMIGATAGFYMARGARSSFASMFIGRYTQMLPSLARDNAAWKVFMLQLSPLVPFGVISYAAALANVSLGAFLVGTGLGIIPGTLIATFIGDRFVEGVSGGPHSALWLAIGLWAALLVVSLLISKVRRSEPPRLPTE